MLQRRQRGIRQRGTNKQQGNGETSSSRQHTAATTTAAGRTTNGNGVRQPWRYRRSASVWCCRQVRVINRSAVSPTRQQRTTTKRHQRSTARFHRSNNKYPTPNERTEHKCTVENEACRATGVIEPMLPNSRAGQPHNSNVMSKSTSSLQEQDCHGQSTMARANTAIMVENKYWPQWYVCSHCIAMPSSYAIHNWYYSQATEVRLQKASYSNYWSAATAIRQYRNYK